jgi:hypothetical protein
MHTDKSMKKDQLRQGPGWAHDRAVVLGSSGVFLHQRLSVFISF